MTIGWWIAFFGLVVIGGLHMNPPRGDNWAGCLGLILGLVVFLIRKKYFLVLRASLVTGFLGGFGFALAQLLKLAILRADWIEDPHPIMEWLHGAFFGIATVAGILWLRNSAPALRDEPVSRHSIFLVMVWLLWIIPYYNFRKCVDQWVKQMPRLDEVTQGLPIKGGLVESSGWVGWLEVVFIVWGIVLITLLVRQKRFPSPLLPDEPYSRGLLLFTGLISFFAFSSLARDLTNFDSGRELPIQVAITIHALVCILLVHWIGNTDRAITANHSQMTSWKRLILCGFLGGLLTVSICSLGKEVMFRKEFAGGFYMDHIRFGPQNTNEKK